MQCQICGKIIENNGSNVCPQCLKYANMDNSLKHMSNEFYNRGLKKAHEKDISGAIKDLEKSITYDKENYYARNLIGLCYRELGMYGEASKNWFLSRYNEFEDNKVQTYIEEIGEELGKNKDIVTSIELYNQALIKIQSKELAAAYQLLTDAIEKNEKLVPAYNLLTLVHLIQGQRDNAIPLIDKVLSIDVKNEKALYYYSCATKNKYRAQQTPVSMQNNVNRHPMAQQNAIEVKETTPSSRKNFYAYIGATFVATIVLSYFIFSLFGQNENDYDALNTQYQELIVTSKRNADTYTADIAAKDTQIATLQTENEELKQQLAGLQSNELLVEVDELYKDKNYVDAAAKLYVIDSTVLTGENLTLYESIYKEIYAKAINVLYKSGLTKFYAGNFADAKSDLQTAYVYSEETEFDNSVKGDIIYHLARCNEELGDVAQAKEYYTLVIQKYPDYSKDSNDRLAALK